MIFYVYAFQTLCITVYIFSVSCIWYFLNDASMNGEAQCWLAREWAPCRHPRAKRDLDRRSNRAKFRRGAVTQVYHLCRRPEGLQKQELVNIDTFKLQKSNSEHCRTRHASFDKSTGFWWRTLQRSIRTPGWTITVSTSQWISMWRTQLRRSLCLTASFIGWVTGRNWAFSVTKEGDHAHIVWMCPKGHDSIEEGRSLEW